MNQIEKDIAQVIQQKKYFEKFHSCSFLVTGATGLLGSILIKCLLSYSKINSSKIKIYACCRNEKKFNSIFRDFLSDDLIPVYSDILNLKISDFKIDYVVHGASITDSKTFIEKPVETINIAIDGTKNLLDQLSKTKIKSFVYLSSLEVYGNFPSSHEIINVQENQSGYIDSLSIRSSYSEGKRMVENLCCAYGSEYNVPVKIVRLCQTFGAGVEYSDNRVFAQFARSVIESKNIVLKTKGETVRNYCYTTDAVTGILTVLSEGKDGNAYNIANSETTCSICEMAQMCCNLNTKIKVEFDIAEDATKLGYNPVVKIKLDSSKLEQLDWKPQVNLQEMLQRLITSMIESR